MNVQFVGVVGGADGFGAANRGLVKYLQREDCFLTTLALGGTDRFVDVRAMATGASLASAASSSVRPDVRLMRCTASLYPGHFEQEASKVNALWTVWELGKWPEAHLRACGLPDLLITSTEFCRKALNAGGVENVHVVPEGVDPDHYYQEPLVKPRFRFLYVGEWNPRKNVQRLVRVFAGMFAGRSDVELVLKLHLPTGLDPMALEGALSVLSRHDGKSARVVTHVGVVPDDRMADVYNQCDVLVAPSHAEAFLRPAVEAAFCGVPTITTGWGGQTDYLSDKNSWLLPYTLGPALKYGDYSPEMLWAHVSDRDLGNAMWYAFENRDEVRRKGREALALREELSWSKCTPKLVKLFEEAVAKV